MSEPTDEEILAAYRETISPYGQTEDVFDGGYRCGYTAAWQQALEILLSNEELQDKIRMVRERLSEE